MNDKWELVNPFKMIEVLDRHQEILEELNEKVEQQYKVIFQQQMSLQAIDQILEIIMKKLDYLEHRKDAMQ